MSALTRKQAIYKAIELLSETPCTEEVHNVIMKLEELANDIPITAWTKETILDTITQFAIENKRNPTTTDLKRNIKTTRLPPHPVIKHRFGITAKEFLLEYYPPKCTSKIYSGKSNEEWIEVFIAEYKRIKPTSCEEYNAQRLKDTPSWQTIARLHNTFLWNDFKELLNLPTYNKQRKEIPRDTINFIIDRQDNLTDLYIEHDKKCREHEAQLLSIIS